MLEFARLPQSERNVYFEQVADRRDLTKRIVEKDFWVCFSLHVLFSTPELADKFVFKGGTSLSKVFGVIKRFSEDVDLSVDPEWLGFGGERRPDAAKSRSQFDKRWKKLNDACADAAEHKVQPALERAIRDALGPAPAGAVYLVFKFDEQTHSPVLTFRYPTAEPDTPGYVQPQVKLELGSLNGTQAREIWLVEPAPKVVEKLKAALGKLGDFMQSQGLEAKPESVPALRGDEARAAFIERFREVQRLKTQLDQYTDLPPETAAAIETLLPKDELNAFRGVYLETAQRLRAEQGRGGTTPDPAVDQLDFEFVLFASADIDYDYIMALLARFSQQTPSKQAMSREQLIGLIQADAKFMDERDIITDYVRTLQAGQGLDEKEIRAGYRRFRDERRAAELAAVAQKHGLAPDRLQTFVHAILQRMVFDGEQLTELLEPLGLAWKDRRVAELALMADLVPLLKQRAAGRDISGLSAYEQ